MNRERLTIAALFVVFFFSRVFVYWRFGLPGFGYDFGIYHHLIGGYFEKLFSPPVPFGFTYFSNGLKLLGESTLSIQIGWYFFLALGLWAVWGYLVKSQAKDRNTIITALFLFSLSLTQFEFFRWYYYRSFLAIFFLLGAIWLFSRRSYWLIPVLAAMGVVHPLTLVPLALTLLIYFFLVGKEEKKYLVISLGFAFLFLLGNLPEYLLYFQEIQKYGWLAQGYVDQGRPHFTGQFIGWWRYACFSWWYLPLALLGLLRFWRQYLFWMIFLLVNLALLLSQTVFYHRYFVTLDLAILFFAAVWLAAVWQENRHIFLGRWLIGFWGIGLALTFSWQLIMVRPSLDPEEWQAIQELPALTESDYVVAFSDKEAPWLYGFSGKKVIAPNMFEENKWNREEWARFWLAQDISEVRFLLSRYGAPAVYIFLGEKNPVWRFDCEPVNTQICLCRL